MTPAITPHGSSPVRAPALHAVPPTLHAVESTVSRIPSERDLPSEWALPPQKFEVRCADVHLLRCDLTIRGSSPHELIARLCAHGASVHGFTPTWYCPERVAAMAGAVIELN